jgi:hypothetical protein
MIGHNPRKMTDYNFNKYSVDNFGTFEKMKGRDTNRISTHRESHHTSRFEGVGL